MKMNFRDRALVTIITIRNFKLFLMYIIAEDFDEGIKVEMEKCKNQLQMITIGCNKQQRYCRKTAQ